MSIVRHKNIFLGIGLFLVLVSLGGIVRPGLDLGIDFSGGTLIEFSYQTGSRPSIESIRETLADAGFERVMLQPTGESGVLLRLPHISDADRQKIFTALSSTSSGSVTLDNLTSIGPVIGSELKRKSIYAIIGVILLIVLYVTYAFRKVSQPVMSWKYGLIAIVTLLHDVIVASGFYVLYSYFTGAEVDVLFVTALMAVLGFSVHDTIVVFDRIRENLSKNIGKGSFSEIVEKSLQETFTRSVTTSFTVILTLLALIFFGGAQTVHFSVLLLVGIIAGTYSSLCIASPLLVLMEARQHRLNPRRP